MRGYSALDSTHIHCAGAYMGFHHKGNKAIRKAARQLALTGDVSTHSALKQIRNALSGFCLDS